MAKIMYGPMIGAASGGVGNCVFTRNRYGGVLRIGVIPTRRVTQYTVAAREKLTAMSKAWGALDEASRASWATWAQNNPIVDRLGAKQVLAGNAAFIQANVMILLAGGSPIETPVIQAAPAPISGLTLTATDPSTVSLAWTSGALEAKEHLFVWVAIVTSKGREYYRNLLKLAYVGAAAGTTPAAIGTQVNSRFGYVKAGSLIYVHAQVVNEESGLVSGISMASTVVVAP